MRPTKNPSLEKFISKVCQYGNKYEALTPKAKSTMSGAVRNFIYQELPSRHSLATFDARPLVGCDTLRLFFENDRNSVIRKDENLWVMSSAPDWSRGLRPFFRDESLYQYISWFLHFAQQYVSRACFVDVIGSIAIAYNTPTHFFSWEGRTFYTRSGLTNAEDVKSGFLSDHIYKMNSPKQKMFRGLANAINSLDPFVNRAIYNYTKALELSQSGFFEETILSFDKTVDVIRQYFTTRNSLGEGVSFEELSKFLHLSEFEEAAISQTYKLRCYFGAHPAHSKWWDFGEMFDEEFVNELQADIRSVLFKFIFYEEQNRQIQKNPADWSNWFSKHWETLWDSIWFEKIQKSI